ncbi:hypothetical protein BpHYR1_000473 [Brachionus plicatilis]|uniref:Uncharacterized protein n=1 Tax=Brachionus plicatilis TaxID=10195 RepID=A0A3M7RMT0_BRAPC|nr:hypothetical protein BpHYR1_000473 [Brachionus plicatilis]
MDISWNSLFQNSNGKADSINLFSLEDLNCGPRRPGNHFEKILALILVKNVTILNLCCMENGMKIETGFVILFITLKLKRPNKDFFGYQFEFYDQI